ncbi:hypothetical protein FZEAL_4579 [Fusarium zealandicum]|uniref:Uncharacterized protein n=1 Tax=Fusarium zealandicum TaxID=1053134 RepID=A0A8H4XLA1_9HYPO|nr:hypothetical protein FZEAL_4579 [Fusarium zealandicum]
MAQYHAVRDHEVLAPPRISMKPGKRDPITDYAAVDSSEASPIKADLKSGLSYLEVTEHPLSAQTEMPAPRPRSRSKHWYDRIGYPGLLVLAIGTVVILASCAILIFLWWGAYRARNRLHRPESWDEAVFREWSTRLVTICSAAIRASMGFQIGLLVAAMAAVILETTGGSFSDTAILSIQRASSSSPSASSILPAAFRQFFSSNMSGPLHCLILSLTFIIALVSTFTSTILLFDFGTQQITAPEVTATITIGFDNSTILPFNGISYWKSRPLAHWRFAETTPDKPQYPKGVADTGDVYRAMLPFQDAEARSSLEYYAGPAVVTNLRTACVAPTLDNANITYMASQNRAIDGLYLQANVYAAFDLKEGLGTNSNTTANVTCRLHSMWHDSNSWPSSLCSITTTGLTPIEEGAKNPLSGWSYAFRPVLLLNASALLNGVAVFPDNTTTELVMPDMPEFLQNLTFDQAGAWTTALTANGTEAFKASICFVSNNLPHRYNVTMSGRAISSEPNALAKWSDLNHNNGTGILKQLGVDPSSQGHEERGILDLDVRSGAMFWADSDDDGWVQSAYHLLWATLFEYSVSGSWSFSNDGMDGWLQTLITWPAHPEHSAIFQAILQTTDDPSQAVQALAFRFYQMIYYDWLPNFDPSESVKTVNAKDMLIPMKWTGLIVVMAIVALHLVLTISSMILFVKRTHSSFLGNAWQAVSQMVSPETGEIIRIAGGEGVRDTDVEGWAKSEGRSGGAYGLSTSVDSGRTEIRMR